ncbi:MAG: HAD family phosphatase, partial [Chloroflexota bacterium]
MTDYTCPPKAIVFDMDGLLVDSERLWKVAETALLEARGKEYSEAKHAPFIGMGLAQFLPNIKRVYELDDDVATLETELIERIMGIVATDTAPQPGAYEIVDWVIEQKIPHGIASSSPLSLIHATIGSQEKWAGGFTVRASAEEVPLGKPAPDVYLLAAERMGVAPTDCMAFEDSPNGARAAVAAGMTCFAVPDLTHTTREAFEGVTPYIFDSLHEVLAILR